MSERKLSKTEAWSALVACYNSRALSRQNGGMTMARLIDRREAYQRLIGEAQAELCQIEREVKCRLLDDSRGMENCLTVNWRKLSKLYGG